jgi:hypothetical protein
MNGTIRASVVGCGEAEMGTALHVRYHAVITFDEPLRDGYWRARRLRGGRPP